MGKLYLYDPISNHKTEINYELLAGITGIRKELLRCYKSKKQKLSSIKRYIIDDKTTLQDLYRFMCKEEIQDEIWKDIRGSCGRYRISNYGRIMRVFKNGKTRLLMAYARKNKGLFIKVAIGGKIKVRKIHRLVADHFVENKNGHPNVYVYHKNEDIYYNHEDNLAWIDNVTLGKMTAHKSKSIPVLKIDVESGEVLDEYTSMAEAGRFNYLHRETIRLCITGKLNTAGGFKWAVDTAFCS